MSVMCLAFRVTLDWSYLEFAYKVNFCGFSRKRWSLKGLVSSLGRGCVSKSKYVMLCVSFMRC